MIFSTLLEGLATELQLLKSARNAEEISACSLRRILYKAKRTHYGKLHELDPGMTMDSFRASVPIAGYKDYSSWLERVIAGEPDVLWPGLPLALVTTSGTTAESKTIPITKDFLDAYHRDSQITYHRIMIHHPGLLFGGLLTLGGPFCERIVGGIPLGSITGQLYGTLPPPIQNRLVLPRGVSDIKSQQERLYAICRLALESQIAGIISVVPGSLLVLKEAMDEMIDEIISDIAQGELRQLSSAPRGLENLIRIGIRPNPKRAVILRESIRKYGEVMPKAIWPVKMLCTYVSDISERQRAAIDKYFGRLTLVDPGLVASEGRVSVGIQANSRASVVLPSRFFVEFAPLGSDWPHNIAADATTVLPNEMCIGREYTPIMSSPNGLLRYHLGDVIKVVGFNKGFPLIEYEGRLDRSVSVAGEKMSEAHVRRALSLLRVKSNLEIADWAVGVSWKDWRPRYTLAYEGSVSSRHCCQIFDNALKEVNVSYSRKRDQQLMEIAEVKRIPDGVIADFQGRAKWIGQSKPRRLYETHESDFERLLEVR